MRRVLVIKTGTTLPELRPRRGDYEDWIVERLGLPWERIELVVAYEGETLPDPHEPAGALPGWSSGPGGPRSSGGPVASPHFSPRLYCGRASPHSDARFRDPAPRRTSRYASGAEPRNLTPEHESARPRYEAW